MGRQLFVGSFRNFCGCVLYLALGLSSHRRIANKFANVRFCSGPVFILYYDDDGMGYQNDSCRYADKAFSFCYRCVGGIVLFYGMADKKKVCETELVTGLKAGRNPRFLCNNVSNGKRDDCAEVCQGKFHLEADMSGGEDNGREVLRGDVDDGFELLFHADRGAAAVNIAGQG